MSSQPPQITQFLDDEVLRVNLPLPDRIGNDCPICHEPYQQGEEVLQIQRCGHIFHGACLTRWLNQPSSTCPTCRRTLVNYPRQNGSEETQDDDDEQADDDSAYGVRLMIDVLRLDELHGVREAHRELHRAISEALREGLDNARSVLTPAAQEDPVFEDLEQILDNFDRMTDPEPPSENVDGMTDPEPPSGNVDRMTDPEPPSEDVNQGP